MLPRYYNLLRVCVCVFPPPPQAPSLYFSGNTTTSYVILVSDVGKANPPRRTEQDCKTTKQVSETGVSEPMSQPYSLPQKTVAVSDVELVFICKVRGIPCIRRPCYRVSFRMRP